ncbi:MAG: ShlB/FhaC/HecB family hemolysin secretion/activation protein [Cyanobacteriota bacterium]|nr:ShlB/FhaC/HecB family hemolysin secretion/activation protein [Cyanobacteriota bacterium]
MPIEPFRSLVTPMSLFYLSWCSAACAQLDSAVATEMPLPWTATALPYTNSLNSDEISNQYPPISPAPPASPAPPLPKSGICSRSLGNGCYLSPLETGNFSSICPPESSLSCSFSDAAETAVPSTLYQPETAQALPPPGSLDPPSEPPTLPETPQSPSEPFFPIPPETPTVPRPSSNDVRFQIRRIEFQGNTVFSEKQLQAAVSDFKGRDINYDDLLEIRAVITRLYTNAGYTTSGAFLPPQDLTAGVLLVQVAEGKLERIEITGLERLREGYVRGRVEVATQPPLNVPRLETALQLLQINPIIEQIQAELSAGTAPGLSILNLEVKEASALDLGVLGENTDSPTVGSDSVTVYAAHNNFAGLGDRLSADIRDTRGLTQYSLGYEIPFNPYDGTFSFRYSNSRSQILEPPFATLDIRSQSDTLSFALRQPLIRTPQTELEIGVALDLRQSQTFVFGDRPFSFSLGPEQGRSKVSVLRFSQEWVNRTESRVLGARSQLNVGLNWLNATINDTGVDGDFLSWNGQFQWVEAFSPDSVLIARIGTQIAFDPLLPFEQFSLGGDGTVRGYRRNIRVGDSGVNGSVEGRFTIVRDPGGFGTVQLVPFFDFGMVWNANDDLIPNPDPRIIASTGLSLRWQWNRAFAARLDWGVPLIPVATPGNTLQDRGVVFSIRFQPF